MGIHYDYKSTRGDKARKRSQEKSTYWTRRAKTSANQKNAEKKPCMTSINLSPSRI